MAKAKFAKGLRRGSTKSETYSTLTTRKEGKIQIIKDRVYDVANPQTTEQMKVRLAFATSGIAAKEMIDIIGISTEGITNPNYGRQMFISRNAKLLRQILNNEGADMLAAWSPKGNTQLIANSYIMSEGSLSLPAWAQAKTTAEDGASFKSEEFASLASPNSLPYGDYTAAQLWKTIFGLNPGDQVTFPQVITTGDIFMSKGYVTSDGENVVEDLVRRTFFAAPRIVLLSTMPSTTLAVGSSTTWAAIAEALKTGVDMAKSYEPVVDTFCEGFQLGTAASETFPVAASIAWDDLSVSNDDLLLGICAIISRKEASGWKYTTSQMVCIHGEINTETDAAYFGYTFLNALQSYQASTKSADRNFLQTATQNQIVPQDFQ